MSSLVLYITVSYQLLRFLNETSLAVVYIRRPIGQILYSIVTGVLKVGASTLQIGLTCTVLIAIIAMTVYITIRLVVSEFIPILVNDSHRGPILRSGAAA